MEIPDIHVLKAADWQVFGTLTFRSENLTPARRLSMWFALTRKVCKWWHVYFPELLWCLRLEQGDKTGRVHYHCLIGGLPMAAVSHPVRFQRENGSWDIGNRLTHSMESFWRNFAVSEKVPVERRRVSRFSIYDARLNGAAYITKCLGIEEEGRYMKDVYESGKFGLGDCRLILSDSLSKLAACRSGANTRSTDVRRLVAV